MNKLTISLAATCCLALASCTGVKSMMIGDEGDSGTGLVYFMPTTRIPLVVSINYKDDQLKVSAGEPQYIADETKRYRVKSIFSPGHAEIVEFKVNANGLLTTADLKSEGRLDEAVVAAAKSAAFFLESAGVPSDDQRVFVAFIDVERLSQPAPNVGPSPLDELNAEIEAALRANMALAGPSGWLGADTHFLNQAKDVDADRKLVTISVARVFSEGVGGPDTSEDCGIGFCYRLPVSYVFTAKFFNDTVNQVTFAVPNGSPIYAAALDRGLFTTWETKTVLSNGMLQSYKRTVLGSELEELLMLPADIVGGLIAGITQKGQLFNARSTLLQSEINLLDKRDALKMARTERESAFLANPLFSFVAGTPKVTIGGDLIPGVPSAPQIPANPVGTGGPSGPQTPGNPGVAPGNTGN